MRKTIKSRLIVGSFFLFTCALGINVILNSSSVDKLCEDSMIARYRLIGEDLQRSLSKMAISQTGYFGSYEVENLLNKTKAQLILNEQTEDNGSGNEDHSRDRLTTVSVMLPDQVIAASTNINVLVNELATNQKTLSIFIKKLTEEAFNHYRHDKLYFLNLPIRDAEQNMIASIVLTLSEDKVQVHNNTLIRQEFKTLLLIFICGLVILYVFFMHIGEFDISNQNLSKTHLSLILFIVICGAQIAFSVVSTLTFTDQYLKMNKQKAKMRVGLLKGHIDSVLAANGNLSNFVSGERMLSGILAESPELNDISIFDNKWHPLYIATKQKALNCQNATIIQVDDIKRTLPDWEPEYNVRITISVADRIEGYISTNISKTILYNRLIEITLDSITVLVISILFLVEMMIFIFYIVKEKSEKYQLFSYLRRKKNYDDPPDERRFNIPQLKPSAGSPDPIKSNSGRQSVHYGLMRPAAFLLLFGYDLSMSFLPLHTEKLYAPLFGLSKDVIMGLPISVELFFVGMCILASGIWLDKRGWHEPFISGLFLAGAGTLYSWWAPDVMNFIVSRAITGSGYGLALMASQGFVIEYSDARSKAQGLAYLFAGIYAGSLCGGATGAMLADRFDYSSVFFAGALVLFSVIVYSFIFLRRGMKKPQVLSINSELQAAPMKKVTRFLTNRIVIALVFFSSLPAAIAVVGFLNYFSPIYLNRIGASQSTIGRILMIYGVCLIYIGPLVSRYVDASNKKRLYIFMGCALGSLAFLTFNVVEGIIAAAVSMFLLGISSSFVLASQSAYTLRLKVTEELGAGKSIGIFRATSRGGQVLGPIVFSWLILSTNIEDGITYFGLAYFVFAVIFLLLTMKDERQLAF